ncbi:MAG: glycosyltransferase family 2 protein [Deltaproteobacteria bacterium]|nr:MAG: glycosyltransferase family 2 protein [Deltaproteobacteria bacterium]
MHKTCAVIPYYNHPQTIADVVKSIQEHDLPCVVVNDGSNEEATATLVPLDDWDNVTIVHHQENQGKGGAVQTGLRWAHENGYSHALQVDADGQHNLEDIPRFLAESKKHPNALVAGKPVYDETVPMGRFIARYITHVWVWIETLSFHIKDTMCGFRVYPLKETVALMNKTRLGLRMDFDIEVMVRMYWRWVPIIQLDTAVTYGGPGGSHFQPLHDNVLISWLHTRLFLGMLLRSPKLLLRWGKRRAQEPQSWLTMQERGASWGIRVTLWTYRVLGRRICRGLVYGIIFYFTLFARGARRASQSYLKKLRSYRPSTPEKLPSSPGFWSSYRHFLQFGFAALDKFAAWMGKLSLDQVDTTSLEELRADLRQGQGVVILSTHFGNIEVLRALRHDSEFVVNALMFVSNAAKFNRILKEVNPGTDMKLIATESIGMDTAIAMKEKIARGEIVAMLADRVVPGTEHRCSEVSFLGEEAPFPHGPMILASLLDCPVYLMFAVATGANTYKIHCELFANPLKLPRKHREAALQENLEKLASRLEDQCELAPYQWYNFYDFWTRPTRSEDKPLMKKGTAHEVGT